MSQHRHRLLEHDAEWFCLWCNSGCIISLEEKKCNNFRRGEERERGADKCFEPGIYILFCCTGLYLFFSVVPSRPILQ